MRNSLPPVQYSDLRPCERFSSSFKKSLASSSSPIWLTWKMTASYCQRFRCLLPVRNLPYSGYPFFFSVSIQVRIASSKALSLLFSSPYGAPSVMIVMSIGLLNCLSLPSMTLYTKGSRIFCFSRVPIGVLRVVTVLSMTGSSWASRAFKTPLEWM